MLKIPIKDGINTMGLAKRILKFLFFNPIIMRKKEVIAAIKCEKAIMPSICPQ